MGTRPLIAGTSRGSRLMRLQQPPTAIIESNNRCCRIDAIVNELSLACPEQVSLGRLRRLRMDAAFTPPLTVLAQPAHEIGRKRWRWCSPRFARRGSADGADTVIRLKAELRIRESARPPVRCPDKARCARGYAVGPGSPLDGVCARLKV